jgi:hypothetical protein
VEVPVADNGVVVRAGVLLWIVAVAVDEAADDARGSSDDRREVVGAEIDAVDASTRFLARSRSNATAGSVQPFTCQLTNRDQRRDDRLTQGLAQRT